MPAEFQMTDDTSHHLQSVMAHLAKSLKLLDKAQAPGDIGAYVDLALQRVRQTLGLPEVAVEIGIELLNPEATKLMEPT